MAQSLRSGDLNTCKCEPPIRSQATAAGFCTRTQDDGNFCDLTFSLSQTAASVSQTPAFETYAKSMNFAFSKESVGSKVKWLDSWEISGQTPPVKEVAASVQAVAAVAGFQRPRDDATQEHFRDISDILRGAIENQQPNVVQSLGRFTSSFQGGPETETVPAGHGRTYVIVTTPGCIAFRESRFTFMVKAKSTPVSCEQTQ